MKMLLLIPAIITAMFCYEGVDGLDGTYDGSIKPHYAYEGVDRGPDGYRRLQEQEDVYQRKVETKEGLKVEPTKTGDLKVTPTPRYHGYAFKLQDSETVYYFQEKPVIEGNTITFNYNGDEHSVNGNWYLVNYK